MYGRPLCILESKCYDNVSKAPFSVGEKPAASVPCIVKKAYKKWCSEKGFLGSPQIKLQGLCAENVQMIIPNSIPLLTQHTSRPVLCHINWCVLRNASSFQHVWAKQFQGGHTKCERSSFHALSVCRWAGGWFGFFDQPLICVIINSENYLCWIPVSKTGCSIVSLITTDNWRDVK